MVKSKNEISSNELRVPYNPWKRLISVSETTEYRKKKNNKQKTHNNKKQQTTTLGNDTSGCDIVLMYLTKTG